MNSRLNITLREKNGLTYNVESGFLPYSDTGIFQIYYGVEPASFNKTTDLIHTELKKIRENKLGATQLKNAKQQLCGQMAIHYEYNLNEMFSMAKSLIQKDEIISFEQLTGNINALTSSSLIETANEIFLADSLSMITYNPK